MHKISVIIPIYNVEPYLAECLDSVIHQTYQNLEIILVNDGSTDACPQICEDYAAQDQRIVLIHKKNGGLSDARNAGLAIATGDYISFVDSDDLLSLDFYQILLQTLIEKEADIIECEYRKFKSLNELKILKNTHHQLSKIYQTEIALELLMKEYLKQVVWNKIYKKEIINGFQFPKNRINEDEFWTYKVFGNAKTIAKIDKELYFYRQQETSIMGKSYSLKRLDGLYAIEDRITYMIEYFPNLENLAIHMFCNASMFHYQQLFKHNHLDPQKKYRKEIYAKVKQYQKWSVLKKWHWKDIVWFLLFIYLTVIYMKLRDYMEVKAEKFIDKNND